MSLWKRSAKLFRETRQHLIEFGWERGWGYPDGATCIVGGLRRANGIILDDYNDIESQHYATEEQYEVAVFSEQFLTDVINDRFPREADCDCGECGQGIWESAIDWNDSGAGSFTDIEIALLEAADRAEAKHRAEMRKKRAAAKATEVELEPVAEAPKKVATTA